jgi:hypothetical protein
MSFESAILMGGTKHFCEIGIESYLGVKNDEITEDWALGKFGIFVNNTTLYPFAGYRYQAPKGFLFKANVGVYPLDGPIIAPMVAFGYSF